MIGKLIPAGTGFEPGQFSSETPGEETSGKRLEGRVLNLFGDDIDDDFIEDEIDDLDDDLDEDELEEDVDAEIDDDLDGEEMEIVE